MANPLDRIGPASLSTPATPVPAPVRQGRSFREALDELTQSISSGERAVDRVIAQAAAGRDFSAPELIAIQARVYRYTQELELVSKLVDKACAGVKQTLQTQV